ncbi:hypothetical protein C2G38_2080997, partial [Gigaspora rosea]
MIIENGLFVLGGNFVLKLCVMEELLTISICLEIKFFNYMNSGIINFSLCLLLSIRIISIKNFVSAFNIC